MEMQVCSSGMGWTGGMTLRDVSVQIVFKAMKETLQITQLMQNWLSFTQGRKMKNSFCYQETSIRTPPLRFIFSYLTLGQVTPTVLNFSFSGYAVVIIIYTSLIIKCMRSP